MAELYDIVVRQSLYLEAVKEYHAQEFNLTLSEIRAELAKAFAKIEGAPLDKATVRQLYELRGAIKETFKRLLGDFYESQQLSIAEYVQIERDITAYAIEDHTGEPIAKQEDNDIIPLFPFAVVAATKTTKLLDAALKLPIPANGQTFDELARGFFSKSADDARRLLAMAVSNKQTVQQALRSIVGNEGLLGRMFSQWRTIISTGLQHLGSLIKGAVNSLWFPRYIWISVIDSRTTQICTDRDQRIYYHGVGPMPPAHYNCRSTTLPVESTATSARDNPGSLTEWLRQQPNAVQDDILGVVKAFRLRNGNLNIDEPTVTKGLTPLSPTDYGRKRGLITA